MNKDYNPSELLSVETTPYKEPYNGVYVLHITCDSNDADYIRDTCTERTLDELQILILSYVSHYHGPWEKEHWGPYYGHHVVENDIEWLEDYLWDQGWLLSSDWGSCHSVCSVKIYYYIEGVPYKVNLPVLEDIFESHSEFINYVNELYNKYNNEG